MILDDADAVVFDGTSIRYFQKSKAPNKVVYGDPLNEESYGFLASDENIQREINVALITLERNGTLKKLKSRWFESN